MIKIIMFIIKLKNGTPYTPALNATVIIKNPSYFIIKLFAMEI